MGATRAGDLIWNSGTFDRAFRDVESENFIVSMKYGDHDFFRYLELNPHFFRGSMKKINELQPRREYAGFGEYPSFVGWEYRRFYERLSREPSFCGIHVWCQTGGWSDFRNFTFMKNSSYWNELNTVVTLRIFRYGLTVEEAVISFAGHDDIEKYMEFLRLADEAVMKLLYLPEFASQRLFFNRVRIPPLLHVSWNNVTVTDHLITFYRAFIDDREEIVRSGYEALACVRRMGPMAGELGIPYNHDFHYDTFELLALCLDLMMSDDPRDLLERIRPLLENYERNYPERYRFYINVSGMRRSPVMRLLLFVSARKRPAYRLIDRFLFNRIMARMYLLAFFLMRNRLPGFVNRQGMAVSSIFL
jgi:hypothetical protein